MFDPERAVNETIDLRPAPYALNKVGNLKYIELDYFMTKGCREAQMTTTSPSATTPWRSCNLKIPSPSTP